MAEDRDGTVHFAEAQSTAENEKRSVADEALACPGTITDKVDAALYQCNGMLGKFEADSANEGHDPPRDSSAISFDIPKITKSST